MDRDALGVGTRLTYAASVVSNLESRRACVEEAVETEVKLNFCRKSQPYMSTSVVTSAL